MKLSRFAEGFGIGVDMVQQDFALRFYANYGGSPLRWLGKNNVSVVHQHPGEGAQLTWDSGQDPTPAQNIEPRLIAPISSQQSEIDSYFIREEAYVAGSDTREALYQVSGTPPYFWISVEPADDAHPPDPRGDHRWSLLYHDILGLGASVYQGPGVPIFFAPTPQVPSGIILIGDEIKAIYKPSTPWHERVCRTEYGHIAFSVRVSLKDASDDSFAGVIFRRDIPLSPTADIDTVYNSPGCAIYVNRVGGVDYWNGEQRITIVPNGSVDTAQAVMHSDGLKLEVRSLPNSNDLLIFIHNRPNPIPVASSYRGPHTGLFAQGSGGRIKFLNRDFYDMGAKFRNVFESTARNTLLWTCSYHRQRLPFRNSLYRCNIPIVFTDPGIRETAWAHRLDGTKVSEKLWQSPFPLLSEFKSIYAGKADGSAGVHCLIHAIGGMPDAHFAAGDIGIHLNTLSEDANLEAVCGDSSVTITEWAPYWREDFLWDCKE